MDKTTSISTFRYDQYFQKHMGDQLLVDFFNDKNVQSAFAPAAGLGTVTSLRAKDMPCTKMSFEFFDRLAAAGAPHGARPGPASLAPPRCAPVDDPEPLKGSLGADDAAAAADIVRSSGSIVQCMPQYVDDICVSDKLRELLMIEDSEDYELYSDEERGEVLMRVLRACVVGGPLCQYEDNVKPYFQVTKALYKDFLSVKKNAETSKLEIVTHAYEVRSTKNDGTPLFKAKSGHEFCFVFVDPTKRHVTCWHSNWHNGFFGDS